MAPTAGAGARSISLVSTNMCVSSCIGYETTFRHTLVGVIEFSLRVCTMVYDCVRRSKVNDDHFASVTAHNFQEPNFVKQTLESLPLITQPLALLRSSRLRFHPPIKTSKNRQINRVEIRSTELLSGAPTKSSLLLVVGLQTVC